LARLAAYIARRARVGVTLSLTAVRIIPIAVERIGGAWEAGSPAAIPHAVGVEAPFGGTRRRDVGAQSEGVRSTTGSRRPAGGRFATCCWRSSRGRCSARREQGGACGASGGQRKRGKFGAFPSRRRITARCRRLLVVVVRARATKQKKCGEYPHDCGLRVRLSWRLSTQSPSNKRAVAFVAHARSRLLTSHPSVATLTPFQPQDARRSAASGARGALYHLPMWPSLHPPVSRQTGH